VSASSRIFPTIFPLTYLRFHQFASIHQSCTAKRHCTDWRPLHPVWSSVVLVQQSQRKLLSDVALLLQSARALWLIISSWILGSTDSLRLMRTCVCGQYGMSKKKTELSKNRAELEFQSVHSSGSLPRQNYHKLIVLFFLRTFSKHCMCRPHCGPRIPTCLMHLTPRRTARCGSLSRVMRSVIFSKTCANAGGSNPLNSCRNYTMCYLCYFHCQEFKGHTSCTEGTS
jgi:hypothetical protein